MKYFILLILSAFTNFIAWNYFGIFFIVSVYILFFIVHNLKNASLFEKIGVLYAFYIILNISATFWLYDVNKLDAVKTFILNSFLFLLFSFPLFIPKIKHRLPLFIIVWVIGEVILSKWDLAWPWLNFGNVLGNQWYLIQWYAYVGVYGGSLWILLTAYFIFQISMKVKAIQSSIILTLLLSLPIFSFIVYYYNLSKIPIYGYKKVTCYIAESESSNYSKTKEIYNYILKNNINHTFITTELFYTNLYSDYLINSDISFFYKELFKKHNNLNFIVGTEIINNSAIKFNGITCFGSNFTLIKTKKKYVPSTEFVTPLLRPLYGVSYYTKNNSDNSSEISKLYNTIPFVCYESIFSDFVASFDSNVIIVLASESFLGDNTFGKSQYLNIQRIRAIENGKYLLKSSYNGFSAIIKPNGKISLKLNAGFNTISLPLIKTKSFYQKLIQLLYI